MHSFSFIDHCIGMLDNALQTTFPTSQRITTRPNPAATIPEGNLSLAQKQHAASLMRVNHAGEVSAQALYQGQAFTAHKDQIRDHLRQAAEEEGDHLAWCEQRLRELHASPSLLNPMWYGASFIIGAIAGLAGDRISLGFLAETEEQVTRHLQKHLRILPTEDRKSQAIVRQMAVDENNHALSAYAHGGVALPEIVRAWMRWSSKLLTKTSYYL